MLKNKIEALIFLMDKKFKIFCCEIHYAGFAYYIIYRNLNILYCDQIRFTVFEIIEKLSFM